jgi:hypothetical protein
MRPIKNHAVAKRQAFEAITWLTVPLASVHVGACAHRRENGLILPI